ncbi:MAG: tripartite tricarboxylate transporter substrate binding protein [Gammaproteobacteria bacterium]|nr:tripartite tricarboxylate transporter substrate binding protein [Gammaproteobacteria bacterium]MDH3507490.1 tripartite tricarboxylate transporter substrate binding protein [Gammaproteobacteria bacterium]
MNRPTLRRPVAAALCVAATCALVAFAAVGQEFPSRPIDIVTHASPGGGTDATARSMVLGTKLALDVDMAVVPRTGGGGIVALNYVNSRPRDGHTVLAITPTHLFAIARGQGPIRIEDLVPVARATDDPIVVMVRGDSEVQTLADLIALGRERPIKWGTTQIGGVDHVAGAILAQRADTQLSVVPFSGGGEIVTNLMGGSVDAAGLNLTEALDQIQRGDFRALAVMAEARLGSIPDVPTTVELGYDVVFSTVRGYLVLAGTPEDRIDVLEQGMLEGMRQENYIAYLEGSGLDQSSIAGREAWGAQVQRLYADARQAMIDLDIIKEE